MTSSRGRNSSIELLKIIGIILVVISHVTQTLGSKGNVFVPFNDYVLNLSGATDNLQYLLLAMLRYSGEIGNTIFFVCSAWFFLESDNVDKKKILVLVADMWVISIIILLAVTAAEQGIVSRKLVLMAIFPITFENNWYLNCYIICM